MNLMLLFESMYSPLDDDYLLLDYGQFVMFNVVGTPTLEFDFL